MRRVILYIAASLDGYIARRDDGLDWLPLPTEQEDYGYAALLAGVDTVVMGRKTYDVTRSLGAWPYPAQRTVVFSRRLTGAAEPGVEFSSRQPAELVGELRRTAGRAIWLVGGGEIVRDCLEGGAVDEIILTTIPVLLGDGLPLFLPRPGGCKLARRAIRSYPDGLVQSHYDVLAWGG